MASNKILGIDLGTTNSAFAIMEGEEPEVIVNAEGERTTPSVVHYAEDGEVVVGKPAKNQAVQNPDSTIESIKRHMGDEDHTVTIHGEEYTPEQVSAQILRKIKSDAEDYLGEEVKRAVITVPAYFNDKERNATKNAGEIAGLEVERIVNEPTAASMAYGLDTDEDQTILVYDLGGGTFDVSVLDLMDGVYEVVGTDGDNNLGGDDWTEALVEHVLDEFEADTGIDLRGDSQAMQRVTDAAEDAKEELSSRTDTTVTLPFIAEGDDGPVNLEVEIARNRFEELTADLIDQTVAPIEEALDNAGYEKGDVDEVILIGGSTRMPQVYDLVDDLFDVSPKRDVNPDEAVALGAAVQGGILDDDEHGENVDDIVLLDVTPLSLGVETKNGLFERIIKKNTTIPTEGSKIFTTASDNQTSVGIKVYQGEREIAEENELLGEFTLDGIPPAPAGDPEIEVTFAIDENGIVNVSAHDRASDNEKEISVGGGIGLSDDEVERMRQEAEEHAEEDERRRRRIEAEENARSAIDQAEGLLKTYDDVPEETAEAVERAIKDVEEVLEDDKPDLDAVEEQTEKLNEAMKKFGHHIHS